MVSNEGWACSNTRWKSQSGFKSHSPLYSRKGEWRMKDAEFKNLQPVITRDNTIYWACWCKHCNICLNSKERSLHLCKEYVNREWKGEWRMNDKELSALWIIVWVELILICVLYGIVYRLLWWVLAYANERVNEEWSVHVVVLI